MASCVSAWGGAEEDTSVDTYRRSKGHSVVFLIRGTGPAVCECWM